jgi:hypothetical protein
MTRPPFAGSHVKTDCRPTCLRIVVVTPWVGRLVNGTWAVVPWVLPAGLGFPAVWLWVRNYRRKFGELGQGELRLRAQIAHGDPGF